MAIFKTLIDLVTLRFFKNSSEDYQSYDNFDDDFCNIKFSLNKDNQINLNCIIPDINEDNLNEVTEKFAHLLKYVISVNVVNDIIMTFGENIEQESNEYKIFVKQVLGIIARDYNKYIAPSKNRAEEMFSDQPLVRPMSAIKNIITSEIM